MANQLIRPEDAFRAMAEDMNRIAAENGVSVVELANGLAEWMGSPVRFVSKVESSAPRKPAK